MTQPAPSEALERSAAQFFFEIGFGAAFAQALIANDGKAPFVFSDALVEHAWAIAGEAHDDPAEFDDYLSLANGGEEWKAELERDFKVLRKDYGRAALLIASIQHACVGIDADYMTSEVHHPGYVLIPVEKFEAIRAAVREPVRQEVAVADIAAERLRQIDGEGRTADHDDGYVAGELASAAAAYAYVASVPDSMRRLVSGIYSIQNLSRIADLWPWEAHWWKPKDRRADLVRAGALIAAEIERLDRAKRAEAANQ